MKHRLGVLFLIFVGALVFFQIVLNRGEEEKKVTMADATLPLVGVQTYDHTMGELHGYRTEMDACYMRDALIPLDSKRKMDLTIDTYGYDIDRVSYEVRSLDTQRKIADTKINDWSKDKNTWTKSLQIENLVDEGEEYLFILKLHCGSENLYYYTRITLPEETYAKKCLEFTDQFHDVSMSDQYETLASYLEPSEYTDKNDLGSVGIDSSIDQIGWRGFNGTQIGKPLVSFTDINDTYASLVYTYQMEEQNDGVSTYYNVEEYYRLRMTESRMYVLNFERTLNQIFRGENRFITDNNQIQLGIRDKNIEYAVSETGDVIAFVQQGELWCFDRVNNKIVQVFSFLGAEGINARDNWDQHDIKIARVDEAGSIDFVVYGYMNRGDHEGEVGTAVYHYDGLVHTIEEEIFIPSDVSYEILKAQMGQLMYVNEKGTFYLIMDQKLYSIDTDKRTPEVLVKDLKESCYKVSESNQYFAWVDSDKEYKSDVIHLMNLKNASVYDIKAKKGAYILPLGFIDEDFIYGAAKKDKVMVAAAGNTVFPMKNLTIMNTSENSHSILKTYEPSRGSIGSISVEDYTITIHLIKKSGGHYVAAGTDAIMNREGDTEEKVTVGSTVTDRKETQYQLVMKNGADASKIKMLTSKSVLLENPRDVSVKNKESQEYFYVYKKGDVLLATDEIADAIVCANNHMGVVVDSKQQYVWMRARKSAQTAFSSLKVNDADKSSSSVVQAVSAMLNYRGNGLSVKELIDNGGTPKSAIENTLKDSVVLDISGCTVEEILFYVSKGSPVFAMTGTDSAVLVTGYSSGSIYYYDPQTHSTRSKSYKDADDWFRKAGYIFFTYLDR